MFLKMIKNLVYYIYVRLAKVFNVDRNFVQIYYNKDIELFNFDFINISLKISRNIRKSKRYNLILNMGIPDLKSSLLLFTFLNPHPMMTTCHI